MASPAAAGNAMLIRQYFQDPKGTFWRAVCSSSYRNCNGFSPSGVLVKALVLHSGADMALFNGGGSNDVKLGAAPDSLQGYGRIALYNVLPLQSMATKFDLFVADAVNVPEYGNINYVVKVASNAFPLK